MDNIHGMDICSNIRLSVIIPCYNAERYIENCLNAILQYNLSDVEVIVVNDGSTDSTCEVLKNICSSLICEKKISVINKQNGGVSSARNLGIEHAHGEWITFVDADDIPTQELLSFRPDNKSDIYCFNWKYTTGETANENLTDGIYNGESKKQFLDLYLVNYIFRTPWAKFFRREIITTSNICFNEAYNIGEDNLFMLDYLHQCCTISTVSSLGYIYLRPQRGKYPLSLKKATQFMTLFMEKYNRLQANCPSLLLLLELYYFTSLHDDRLKTRILWEQTPAIRNLQSLCWLHYGKKERIKIITRRIISVFYVNRAI